MPEPKTTTTPDGDTSSSGGEETKISLNIKGETKEFTLAEIKTMAEKAGGADATFREASEMRTKATAKEEAAVEAVEAMELHQKVQGNFATDQEKNRYCDLFNADQDYRNLILGGQVTEPANKDNDTKGEPKSSSPVTLTDLDTQLQETLRGAADTTAKNKTDAIIEAIKNSVDKSEDFGTIFKGLDSSNVDSVKSLARDQIRNGLAVKMRAGQRYSTQLVSDTVKAVADSMQKLGGYLQPAEKPGSTITGFGSDAAAFETQTIDGKPPERVAGDDPNYADNFHKRILHSLRKSNQAT